MNWPLRRALVLGVAVLASMAPAAAAQTVYCGPGTRVERESGGGGLGTIEAIGTQPPHVGWYRISYSWSPGGEWYDPSTWVVYPVGTRQRCSPNARAPQAPQAPRAPRPTPSAGDDDAPVRVPRPNTSPAAAGGGALPRGRYTCSMSSAGGQFPITIVDRSTYSDRGGQSGRYRVAGDQITFESGSLQGTFSRILGPGKFGLSTHQNSSFYGVCRGLRRSPAQRGGRRTSPVIGTKRTGIDRRWS